MRDLSAYAAQCMRELDRLHIRYAQNITFAVNTRAKTRLGVCKKQGDRYTVEIAAPLLDESMPEKLLKETLHHELLHSCRGCMQHTGRWKALAERVNAVAAAGDDYIFASEECLECSEELFHMTTSFFVRVKNELPAA